MDNRRKVVKREEVLDIARTGGTYPGDEEIDQFLDHEERCRCYNCMQVIEWLSRTERGLTILALTDDPKLRPSRKYLGKDL